MFLEKNKIKGKCKKMGKVFIKSKKNENEI